MRMIFGFDYDETITADYSLFTQLMGNILLAGHQVFIVTRRHQNDPITFNPHGVPVIYAGNQHKQHAAEQQGIFIDIWIDDDPGTISPSKIITWD